MVDNKARGRRWWLRTRSQPPCGLVLELPNEAGGSKDPQLQAIFGNPIQSFQFLTDRGEMESPDSLNFLTGNLSGNCPFGDGAWIGVVDLGDYFGSNVGSFAFRHLVLRTLDLHGVCFYCVQTGGQKDLFLSSAAFPV